MQGRDTCTREKLHGFPKDEILVHFTLDVAKLSSWHLISFSFCRHWRIVGIEWRSNLQRGTATHRRTRNVLAAALTRPAKQKDPLLAVVIASLRCDWECLREDEDLT